RLFRALQVTSRLLDEDVVERGLHEIQGLDAVTGLVKGPENKRDVARATLERDQQCSVLGGQQFSEAGKYLRGACRVPIGEDQFQVRPADLRLEGLRRAFGGHASLVDDANVVGELIRFLEVLGCE